MKIGTRQIGGLPYVIAEIGVNHDGSVDRALALADAAAHAGADAVKLQLFRADLLMSRAARLAAYQSAAGESDPVEMHARLELPIDALAAVVERAHSRGLHAIVTPFSVELVQVADRLPWDAFKTASPDVINRPLLDAVAATGRPMIVSTGAATMDEVERAVGWLAGARDRLALLQCVSCYPTRPEDASIAAMADLRRVGGVPVGYSDHTTAVDTGGVAAALGAAILEKHLTYSKSAKGPDHAASLEPAEFAAYASLARDEGALRAWLSGTAPLARDPRHGNPEKRVLDCESDVRLVSRQSLTTRRALPAGHVIARDDLTIKRPGTGIEPWKIDEVVGRRLIRPVEPDTPLVGEDWM